MASRREYLNFILGQLSGLEEVAYRAMYEELPAPKPKKRR